MANKDQETYLLDCGHYTGVKAYRVDLRDHCYFFVCQKCRPSFFFGNNVKSNGLIYLDRGCSECHGIRPLIKPKLLCYDCYHVKLKHIYLKQEELEAFKRKDPTIV